MAKDHHRHVGREPNVHRRRHEAIKRLRAGEKRLLEPVWLQKQKNNLDDCEVRTHECKAHILKLTSKDTR